MKAVLITGDNLNALGNRFNLDADDTYDMLPIGYYLVTDYGNDEKFETLTAAGLDAVFLRGETLQNGFFEITPRPPA